MEKGSLADSDNSVWPFPPVKGDGGENKKKGEENGKTVPHERTPLSAILVGWNG